MTRRNLNIKIEKQGVRFVQGIVEDNHSIFHEFFRDNDQGNDCYIEFVQGRIASNYGVLVQIKSGNSYKDRSGYKIVADRAHLEYWNKGLNLTIGIVYDPEIQKAFWVDITNYLKSNAYVLKQSYHTIRINRENEFSQNTYFDFMQYCFRFRDTLISYEQYGHALEWFADLEKPIICYEGLKSLYINHRDKRFTWFYIISNFSKIEHEGIRKNILGLISNYINPDVFWNLNNIQHWPNTISLQNIKDIINKYFRENEIRLILPYMQDGITRGSFSYLVFLVINMINDLPHLLKAISFSTNLENDQRNFCFWLYMNIAKFHSVEKTLEVTNEYLLNYPFGIEDEAIIGTKESIEKGELLPVG